MENNGALEDFTGKVWACHDCGFVFDAYHTMDGQPGIYSCPVCVETAQQARIEALEKLLREGATGFGRVLIATGDDAAVYDWMRRAGELLGEEPQP